MDHTRDDRTAVYLPSLEEALQYAAEYQLVPISKTILSDVRTPIEVLSILKTVSRNCYILESLEDAKHWGRYTFLGYDPKLEISCQDHVVRIKDQDVREAESKSPQDYIRQVLKAHRSPRLSCLPPFTGGLVGYFSFEYMKYTEPVLDRDTALDAEQFKDFDLMLFDRVIVFDHFQQTIILIANMETALGRDGYARAAEEIEQMEQLILYGKPALSEPLELMSGFQQLFSEENYCQMVVRAKEYIRQGDIFQVVLSNCLSAEAEGSLLEMYRILRTTNPSPYMFYFSSDALEIAGASPETLVKLQGDTLQTFPLAGTRKRGSSQEEDLQIEAELLQDAKELAEHNMLVDLGRNDLGRISRFGSVEVKDYLSVHRFSHVMHIGSTVKGSLKEGCDALDAVSAVLPAGTLSGAPKIRACQIIQELEGSSRGIYGGAIGYLDFTGNMDTCISIRMAVKRNGKLWIRSGAGIVSDSVPEQEYQECINKAQAVAEAVQRAGRKAVQDRRATGNSKEAGK